jgi:hypothetical protein
VTGLDQHSRQVASGEPAGAGDQNLQHRPPGARQDTSFRVLDLTDTFC